MKYSIITPVYNSEKYISECVDSVLAQSYTDWEMILIDDGSTDASPLICDKYSELDPRIKVVHIKNGGAYKARIFAKDYITGEYTIGLDSDDMYSPNCLEQIEVARKKTDADMIVFGRSSYDDSCKAYTKEKFYYEPGKLYNRTELVQIAIKSLDHSLGNKAVRSDIYKKADYPLEEYKLSISLDYLQVVPILCNVNSAYALDENLYVYRYRKDSTCHNSKFANIIDNDWINFNLRSYLSQKGIMSEQLCYYLERAYAFVFLSKFFALRWEITSERKNQIKKLPFLNSLDNDMYSLTESIEYKLMFWYLKNGLWGPQNFFYKVYLKTVVKYNINKNKKLAKRFGYE